MGCNSSSLAGGVAPSKPPKAAAPASAPANDSSTSAVTSGGDPDALQKVRMGNHGKNRGGGTQSACMHLQRISCKRAHNEHAIAYL